MESVKKQNRSGTFNLKPRRNNSERFYCKSPAGNGTQYTQLMNWLPSGHSYHVCQYSAVEQSNNCTDFDAIIRISLKTKEEIKEWLKSMPVMWRIDHTRPTKGQKILFKADYRCHHNTKPRRTLRNDRSSKNTNCPAKMKISLLRTQVYNGRQTRSSDPHVPDYPTIVNISSIHNHSLFMTGAACHKVAIQPSNDLPDLHEDGDDELVEEAGFDEEWDAMCQELSAMVHTHTELRGAALAFIKSFNKMKHNPSLLSSALHVFGCHEALGSIHAGAFERAFSCSRPITAAQSSSVATCKRKLERRHKISDKRPLKSTTSQDHRYSDHINCRESQCSSHSRDGLQQL